MHGTPLLIMVLVVLFVLYRRINRTIGYQKLVKRRMVTRITIFIIVGVLILIPGYLNPVAYLYDVLGFVVGGIIAYYAIRTTSFEWRSNAWYYRPNPWIGAILVVLFIGRIAFDVYQNYKLTGGGTANGAATHTPQLATYAQDSYTTAIFFVLIAYYVIYYTFIIRKERYLEHEGLDKTSI